METPSRRASHITSSGEIPGEDAIAPRDFSSFLVMNSMPIPAAMSPAAWEAASRPSRRPGFLPTLHYNRVGHVRREPAKIVEQVCADVSVVGRSLMHGRRGCYFTTLSPHPDPASAAIVED